MQDETEQVNIFLPPSCVLPSEMVIMRRRESTRIKFITVAILLLDLVIMLFSNFLLEYSDLYLNLYL